MTFRTGSSPAPNWPWRKSSVPAASSIIRTPRPCAPIASRPSSTIAVSRSRFSSATSSPHTSVPPAAIFLRFGIGSLGGKARGLTFVRHLLHKYNVSQRFPGVRVAVPNTLVLATDLFEQFLAENNLESFAIHCTDDRRVARPLPRRGLAAHPPRRSGRLSARNPRSPRRALFQPSGGFAVPALHRRL